MLKLLILDDEGKVTAVPLAREEITIGRKEGNTIRLTDRNVSRFHAKFIIAGGKVFVEDLDSFNGIRVNGDRMTGRCQIQPGDVVQIGDYKLQLKDDGIVPAEVRQAPAPAPRPKPEARAESRLSLEELAAMRGAGAAQPQAPQQAPVQEARKAPEQAVEPPMKAEEPAEPVPEKTEPAPQVIAESAEVIKDEEPAAAEVKAPEAEGQRSDESVQPLPATVEIPPAALLVIGASPFKGREYLLSNVTNTIGRSSDNDIALDLPSISRHHAKVVFQNGSFSVIDLGSADGVLVNGEQCARMVMDTGDIIEIGGTKLLFGSPGRSAPPSQAPKAAAEAPVLSGVPVTAPVTLTGAALKKPSPVPVYREEMAQPAEKGGSRALFYGLIAAIIAAGAIAAYLIFKGGPENTGAGAVSSVAQEEPARQSGPPAAQQPAAENTVQARQEQPPEAAPKKPVETAPIPEKKAADIAYELYNEGNKLYLQNRTQEAIEVFLKAVRVNPRYPLVHRSLGIAYAKMGQGDKAAAEYKLYLQYAPGAPERKQLEKIIADYEKSIRR